MSSRWLVFKCYTALEVLLKLFNNQYIGKEDFGGGFDSHSGEQKTDYNQHHPLVPDMVADDNGYITFESPAGPENSNRSRNCRACAVNKPCTPSLREEVRERSGRAGEEVGGGGGGGGGDMHNTEKGAWQHVFALLISTVKCRKYHSKYLMLVNWKLPYVVLSLVNITF